MPPKKEAAPAPAEAPKAEKARSRAPILPAAWYRVPARADHTVSRSRARRR